MQKRTININLKNIEKVSKNKEFYADFNSGEKIFQKKIMAQPIVWLWMKIFSPLFGMRFLK